MTADADTAPMPGPLPTSWCDLADRLTALQRRHLADMERTGRNAAALDLQARAYADREPS